jgi:hypothetical protein
VRLALSSISLFFWLTFLLPDTEATLEWSLFIGNVPLDPSGKESVWMSMEESAVVGCDCNWGLFVEVVRETGDCGADGLIGACSAIGRGGRAGRCSSSPLSCRDISVLAPLVAFVFVEASELPSSPAIVIEKMMPWSAVAAAGDYIE